MDVERLADQLIKVAAHCSSNQMAAVYRFLLHALGGDERSARAEFVRYLQGDLSPQMLRLACQAIDTSEHLSDGEQNYPTSRSGGASPYTQTTLF